MKLLLIKDGVVVNVIVVQDESILNASYYSQFDHIIKNDENPEAGIGWLFDGNEFTAPPAPVPEP